MSDIIKYSEETFESIKHTNEDGQEFWYARELQNVLEYAKWENFCNVIEKAKEACINSGNTINDHFPDIRKTIKMPKTATMGSTELAANLFRATQTDEKLRRDNIKGKENANKTHFEVGAKVRQTIKELGGTMPEDLPTPDKSIVQIAREMEKKKLK